HAPLPTLSRSTIPLPGRINNPYTLALVRFARRGYFRIASTTFVWSHGIGVYGRSGVGACRPLAGAERSVELSSTSEGREVVISGSNGRLSGWPIRDSSNGGSRNHTTSPLPAKKPSSAKEHLKRR